jgi:hypothetical protein
MNTSDELTPLTWGIFTRVTESLVQDSFLDPTNPSMDRALAMPTAFFVSVMSPSHHNSENLASFFESHSEYVKYEASTLPDLMNCPVRG